MRIVMGKIRPDRPAGRPVRGAAHPYRQRRPPAGHAGHPTGHPKGRSGGKWVFVLLTAAFIATAAAGIREGLAGDIGAVSQKSAVLSAQLVYPQGGKTVLGRELGKLRALFGSSGQTKAQKTSSGSNPSSSG